MTFVELVNVVASRTGRDKQEVADVLRVGLSCITETVMGGGKVALRKFGTFSKATSKAREAFGKMSDPHSRIKFRSHVRE